MQVTKDIVAVSEMARMVGLSRARFYQLMKEGIFPVPARNAETRRPFYDRPQQEQCLEVRRTNRGMNGRTILFYALRVGSVVPEHPQNPRRTQRSPRALSPPSGDPAITEIRHALMQLGVTDVSEATILATLTEVYPDGHQGVEIADLLRSVMGRLNRQN